MPVTNSATRNLGLFGANRRRRGVEQLGTGTTDATAVSIWLVNEAARRLMLEVASALVTSNSWVTVDIVSTGGTSTLRIRSDSDGVGRFVGSQGRTVRAIRTILTGFAAKSGRIYSLDVRDA
jgi:predicted RNA-binding protein YlqC (UPF0109 family)